MITLNDLEWTARQVDPSQYMEWLKLYPAVPDYGMWAKGHFPNGYGVRVARGPLTIGGADGLFEAWVIDSQENQVDDTSLGAKRGNLTEAQVNAFISQIRAL
jgi:hypothetical protein